jgi:hypothetical protein
MVAKRIDAGAKQPVRKRMPPATTPEGREQQMIAAAFDLAEQQIMDGTASAQVITHFLKLGSSRDKLEQEKIALEKELVKSRVEQISSTAQNSELYEQAINMMKIYTGEEPEEQNDEY